jgi:hypothetical protein
VSGVAACAVAVSLQWTHTGCVGQGEDLAIEALGGLDLRRIVA